MLPSNLIAAPKSLVFVEFALVLGLVWHLMKRPVSHPVWWTVGDWDSSRICVESFKGERGPLAELGVPPVGVVPAFDVTEDRHPGLGVGPETAPVDQLTLQRRKETFGHRIVVGAAHRAAGRLDAQFLAALPEGERGVLTAPVGATESPLRAPLLCGHVQGVQDQLGLQVRGHRPAHDAAAEDVQHDRKIEEAGPRRHVGNIRDLQPSLGAVAVKLPGAPDRRPASATAPRCVVRMPRRRADPHQSLAAHKAGDALLPDPDADVAQVANQARRPVGAVRARVEPPDVLHQHHRILLRAGRWRAVAPGIEATTGDPEDATHGRDRVDAAW